MEYATIRKGVLKKTTRHGHTWWGEGFLPPDGTAVAILFAGDLAERIENEETEITYDTAATETKPEVYSTTEDFAQALVHHNIDHRVIYDETRDSLIARWKTVEAIAAELLAKETLSGIRIEELYT